MSNPLNLHPAEYDALCSAMAPLLEVAGWTELSKTYPFVRIYRKTLSRVKFLDNLLSELDDLRYKLSWSWIFKRTISYLRREREYAEAMFSRLDINNTIYTPLSDAFRVFEKHIDKVTQKYIRNHRWIVAMLGPKPDAYYDEVALNLVKATYKSRASEVRQRLDYEVNLRHEMGWYFVFDTLTLDSARVADFYRDNRAITDYTRAIGRRVCSALGVPYSQHTDHYRYFCVPEYGSKEGRLHFHILHMCRELPSGTTDPNIRRRSRDAREIDTFKGVWPYGQTQPLAVRYQGDAFSKTRRWLWPIDKKTFMPIQSRPVGAVIGYISKYVSKNLDFASTLAKPFQKEDYKWQLTLRKLSMTGEQFRRSFRVRMSRNLGRPQLDLNPLSDTTVLQMTRLHWTVTPYSALLKRASRRELCLRLADAPLRTLIVAMPVTSNLLTCLRNLMKATQESNPLNSISVIVPRLTAEDISDETALFIRHPVGVARQCLATLWRPDPDPLAGRPKSAPK